MTILPLLSEHFHRVMQPVIGLASSDFLRKSRTDLKKAGVQDAVASQDTAALFDWIVSQLSFQGISDRIAAGYDAEHGGIRWSEIEAGLSDRPECGRLRSYWHFEDCGYRKGGFCQELDLIEQCSLPAHQLRKGVLNQAAYSLFFFLRDVCDGDLVTWIDRRLESAAPDGGGFDRSALTHALLLPLRNIYGTGDKLWNMILASLLLAGHPARRLWVEAGASMIAIDTLVHNFLHRTGILHQFDACHAYGPRCYAPGGCADIIELFARDFDARSFNAQFPKYFPRFIQRAIWAFCSESGWNICNGRQIDDRARCLQSTCPAFSECERLPLLGSI